MLPKTEKFYVVKTQRGSDGKWFYHRAQASFEAFENAMKEAAWFADKQRAAGVSGTRIIVRRGRNAVVAAFNVNRGDLDASLRNANTVYDQV